MNNVSTSEEGSELVNEKVHAAAITKFLWGVASTLMAAWIVASLSFAWNTNSHCVEFRQALSDIRDNHEHLANEVERLHNTLNDYPKSGELVGLRGDVSHLQYSSSITIQTLNDLTRQVRDIHPWPVQPRNQAPQTSTEP